jgi:hypothetical protein
VPGDLTGIGRCVTTFNSGIKNPAPLLFYPADYIVQTSVDHPENGPVCRKKNNTPVSKIPEYGSVFLIYSLNIFIYL